MKGKWIGIAGFFLLTLMIPYVATLAWTGSVEGNASKLQEVEGSKIWLDRGGVPKVVGLEEYLPGVIAVQMPADYGLEALRAQAVLARTYVCKNMAGGTEIAESALDLDYWDVGQMREQWGDQFQEYYDRITNAVESTKGVTAKFDGQYIDGLFTRASAGMTRDGDARHPYLKAAASSQDVEMDGFLFIASWSREEFAAKINEISPECQANPATIVETLQVVERDSSGYVLKLQAGSGTCTGDEAAAALGMPSPCFQFEIYEDKIRGICKGSGHGYGMSQYGAKAMASKGIAAEEILAYYYQNIELIAE